MNRRLVILTVFLENEGLKITAVAYTGTLNVVISRKRC